jgi:hypothetical protein
MGLHISINFCQSGQLNQTNYHAYSLSTESGVIRTFTTWYIMRWSAPTYWYRASWSFQDISHKTWRFPHCSRDGGQITQLVTSVWWRKHKWKPAEKLREKYGHTTQIHLIQSACQKFSSETGCRIIYINGYAKNLICFTVYLLLFNDLVLSQSVLVLLPLKTQSSFPPPFSVSALNHWVGT